MDQQRTIAVSACLLGHKVRYDGEHQANALIQQLTQSFNIIAVCPEVEIGLGVPREKVELHRRNGKIRLLSSSQPVTDLTDQMIHYADTFLRQHKISGMILKDKSPSCGIANCKLYDEAGGMQRHGNGIFAAAIMQLQPDLAIIQSHLLKCPGELDEFLQQVRKYEY